MNFNKQIVLILYKQILQQCFIQGKGAALPDVDFALPEFEVLAFETTDLSSVKILI